MSNSYLWDRSGKPDPEVEKLESLLRPLRVTSGLREPERRRPLWLPLSVAASIAVLILILWRAESTTRARWEVQAISGEVSRSRLDSGESMETNRWSRARLQLASTGKMELEPNTRIQVLPGASGSKRISLAHGVLHATIWARPGEFSVAAPAATAVDLGCIYTVETNDSGDGFVRVDAGWVALENHGKESFIPGGSICRMSRSRGPGIPYLETSASALRQVVAEFDATGSTSHLQSGLAAATKPDDVTLWHLLRRVPVTQRALVFDRLAALVPLPASLTPSDGDAVWNALGYGDTDWWRQWKSR